MGAAQSEGSLGFILDDYQVLEEIGGLKVLQDKKTEEVYALKEQCFAKRTQYDRCFKRLTNRDENHDCENLLRLTKLWSKQHNGLCSNLFRIYSVYEYSKVRLIDEIEARRKEKKYFDESELYSILQSCLNAMAFQPQHVYLSPYHIFITPDGVLKLAHIDLLDQNLHSSFNPNFYYSPQKIQHFQRQNCQQQQQQSVFSLGMIALHSALLQNPSLTYEPSYKRVNRRKLDILISQVTSLYSPSFNNLLVSMLELSPCQRINFASLQDYINSYFNEQSMILRESMRQSSTGEEKSREMIEVSLKRIESQSKNKQQGSSLAYSKDTMFKPSLPLHTETNNKNQMPDVMAELSENQLYSLPKNHKMLEKTKKSKSKMGQSQKQNYFQQAEQISKTKGPWWQNMVVSKDLLSDYELISQKKGTTAEGNLSQLRQSAESQKCVFVMETYEDKSRYQGMVQAGLKNGYGKLIYQDGVYYEGSFSNDSIHGKGTLYYGENRPAYSGQWVNNKFNGIGTLYNQFPVQLHHPFDYRNFNVIDERWIKFEGIFVNDIKEGKGKIFLSNGQSMQGLFSKGLINGQGVFTTHTGEQIRGLWKDNQIVTRT